MIIKKVQPIPVECVPRGYLFGSAWAAYQKGESVCGIKLPSGLKESERLPQPIFTPTTKAATGHDLALTEEGLIDLVGKETAKKLKRVSLELYEEAAKRLEDRGIIIADTKFEFGVSGEEIILIDELLTPDSSRFWSKDDFQPGRSQKSFDKQFVRDYLIKVGWDKNPPAPELPEEIIRETSKKYIEAYGKITGKKFNYD
jgi:phosphoribosylaminoimidazole-succinocarboxamide synthase